MPDKKVEDKIILGIDPGTNIMGYGLIYVKNSKLTLLSSGVLKLERLDNHPDKLKRIFDRVIHLIGEYKVDEMAIEAPFFGKNVQSMLKLGRAQGVAIAAALSKNVPIEEYTPKKIKQSITGNGNASKEQVAAMLETLMQFENKPEYLDATDGLAAAVCHYYQKGKGEHNKSKGSSWKNFMNENPGRVRK